MAVQNPVTPDSTAPFVPRRPVAPLRGRHARIAAGVQGHVWHGLANTVAIVERAETAERIDQRGDAEMQAHLTALLRIANAAKQRREYQTHRALMEEIARMRLIIELDCHEDDHREAMADHAIETNGALHRANGGVGLLLGQAEAVFPLTPPEVRPDQPAVLVEILPFPLDGAGRSEP